jgi:excisionase family DNA binding protein
MTAAVSYKLKGASAATGVSEDQLRKEIHTGRLPAKMVGRHYLIGAVELRRWYESLLDADVSSEAAAS